MAYFEELKSEDNLKKVIKVAFDTTLDISGGWGYNLKDVTIIHSLNMPLEQLQHTLASMRCYLEMNMVQPLENRYASINLKELKREEESSCEKVIYEVTAMKEELYNKFIDAYKKGYGKKSFDLNAHFEARREATLKREIKHYFHCTFD